MSGWRIEKSAVDPAAQLCKGEVMVGGGGGGAKGIMAPKE
jgi:hypothetical protein